MRWNYKAPDEKVFVSDGVRPDPVLSRTRTGHRERVPPDETRPPSCSSAGKGNLTRDFNVSLAEGGAPTPGRSALEPKTTAAGIRLARDRRDPRTLQIRGADRRPKAGRPSTFTFTNFKENPGLADKTFAFSIPRGADVTQCRTVKR